MTPRQFHLRRTGSQKDLGNLAFAEQRTQFRGCSVDRKQREDPFLDGKKLMPREVDGHVFRDTAERSIPRTGSITRSRIASV